MFRYVSFVFGAAAGVLYARERRERMAMARLGASALETLLNAIDANNPMTGAHVRRVAKYALVLADAADLNEREKRSIERVALFHDVGKLDLALTDIINETTKLTPEDRRAIRTHPQRGADVLKPLAAFYPDLPEGVLSHHECWNGNGYPRKLRGNRIPLNARVVAIADTFDAVTHARSYSHARSFEAAMQVIAKGRGTQFDPDLVDLFLSPPVLEQVENEMRAANAPSRVRHRRRRSKAREEAPDITFRWRTPTPVQPRPDR